MSRPGRSLSSASETDKEQHGVSEDKSYDAYYNADFFEIPEEFASYEFVCEGQDFLYEGEAVRIVGESQESEQ